VTPFKEPLVGSKNIGSSAIMGDPPAWIRDTDMRKSALREPAKRSDLVQAHTPRISSIGEFNAFGLYFGKHKLTQTNLGFPRLATIEPWSDSMNQVLQICCFCEKVLEEPRTPSLQDTIIFGCCPYCLTDDPRAITFRTRKSEPRLKRGSAERETEDRWETSRAEEAGTTTHYSR
jgi:hypothetical protein